MLTYEKLEQLVERIACEEALAWISENTEDGYTFDECWQMCSNPHWLMWLLSVLEVPHYEEVLFAGFDADFKELPSVIRSYYPTLQSVLDAATIRV